MGTTAHIGYIRVSANDQNPDRQLEGIKLDEKFIDYASGKNTDRPELKNCLRYLRKGDVLHVHSLDRLARNAADLQKLVTELTQRGVEIRFHKENMTFKAGSDLEPTAMLMFHVLSSFSQFERAILKERQAEGIAIAKKAGKYKGRKRVLTLEQARVIKGRIRNGEKAAALAREYGICRTSLYEYLKMLKDEPMA